MNYTQKHEISTFRQQLLYETWRVTCKPIQRGNFDGGKSTEGTEASVCWPWGADPSSHTEDGRWYRRHSSKMV